MTNQEEIAYLERLYGESIELGPRDVVAVQEAAEDPVLLKALRHKCELLSSARLEARMHAEHASLLEWLLAMQQRRNRSLCAALTCASLGIFAFICWDLWRLWR